ncbi:MAG: translation initiation factor IF-2 subunit beta, partial [Candidatus Bathyarchaeia archaeon]
MRMEEEYKRLLNRAQAQLPQQVFRRERFEMPKPISTIAGNRTILHNFKEICDRLLRDQNHFLKFLSSELATAG